MMVSICLGVILLLWFHLFTWIKYNVLIGPLSLKEMGSVYLDDIYCAYARGGYELFAPILAVLPAATLFCDDYNSGYLKSILGRAERNRYIKETIICSSVSGGLAVFLPSLLACFFYMVNGEPNTIEGMKNGYSTVFDESVYSQLQYIGGGVVLVLLFLVLAFVFGAIWSNVGLCASLLIPNRYIAVAIPFAFYFTCHLVFYRIGSLLVFSPANMLMPAATFIPNSQYPFIYQLVLYCIITVITEWLMKRRLRDV